MNRVCQGLLEKFDQPRFFGALPGRSEEALECVEAYMKATKMFRDYNNPDNDPVFSEVRQLECINSDILY